MKNLSLTPTKLIPTEIDLRQSTLEELTEHFDEAFLDPIITVKYKHGYLIANGHNRAYFCYKTGRTPIVTVIESDQEALECEEGLFKTLNTIQGIVNFYEEHGRIKCVHQYGVGFVDELDNLKSHEHYAFLNNLFPE